MKACGQSDVPNQVHGAPCESGTESGEDNFVAFFQLVLVLVKTQGY